MEHFKDNSGCSGPKLLKYSGTILEKFNKFSQGYKWLCKEKFLSP